MDIKGIFTNRQITDLQQTAEPSAQEPSIQSDGISAVTDTVEQSSRSDQLTTLTEAFGVQARHANDDLSKLAESQENLLKQKEHLRDLQEKLNSMKEDGSSFFSDIGNFLTGNDPGASEGIQRNQESSTDWMRLVSSTEESQNRDSVLATKLSVDAGLRADLGNLFLPLDAMHGQPKNYDDLQQVVRDLQNLLNSTQIPNEEKLKLQAELNQLDQISHQMPIQPQNPDQNFQEGLQLLASIRSDLSQYVN